MRTFYKKSPLFWIVTRIIWGLLFLGTITRTPSDLAVLDKGREIVYVIIGIYIILMTLNLASEIIHKVPIFKFSTYYTGSVSLLFAIVLIYLIVVVGFDKYGLGTFAVLMVPVWLGLFGIREFLLEKNAS